jgi:hypothetical protein
MRFDAELNCGAAVKHFTDNLKDKSKTLIVVIGGALILRRLVDLD